MSHSSPSPTSYAHINALLRQLLEGSRSILRDRLVGLYLSGSLAVGDFDPTSSDIDFVAVLTDPLDAAAATALERMHEALGGEGDPGGEEAQRLEGFYVPVATLRQHDPTLIPDRAVFFAAGSSGLQDYLHLHPS